MPNKCPNCARDFGIRKMEAEVILAIVLDGEWDKKMDSVGYYCTACNAHWIRPKNEVSVEFSKEGIKMVEENLVLRKLLWDCCGLIMDILTRPLWRCKG